MAVVDRVARLKQGREALARTLREEALLIFRLRLRTKISDKETIDALTRIHEAVEALVAYVGDTADLLDELARERTIREREAASLDVMRDYRP